MPRLLIRKGEGTGKDHAVSGTCVVGRAPPADFVIDDTLASRRHFRVYEQTGHYFVEDLGSTNGTRVNGRLMKTLQLSDGDVIAAGATELVFVQKDMLGAVTPPAVKIATPPALKVPPAAARPPAPPSPSAPRAPEPKKTIPAPIPRRKR